jgi:hypothetical protein
MGTSTPTEACIGIVHKIEAFLHHEATWEELLDDIEYQVNGSSGYGVGYDDGKAGRPETDWRAQSSWRRQV